MKPTLETLLRHHDPAAHRPHYTEEISHTMVDNIIARASLREASDTSTTQAPRRSTRRRWALAGVGVATVAALGIASLVSFNGQPVPGMGQSASAAQVLGEAAEKVRFSDPQIRPDQFWKLELKASGYQNWHDVGGAPTQLRVDSVRTAYQNPTIPQNIWYTVATSNVTQVEGQPTDLTQAYQNHTQHMTCTREQLQQQGDWSSPNTVFVQGLPREVNALRQRLEQDSGQGDQRDAQMFAHAAYLVGLSQIPSELRAALYQVMATIGGVQIANREVTINGRTGVAISGRAVDSDSRLEVVIDPVTGQTLAARFIALNSDGSPRGDREPEVVTVSQSVVDQVPADVKTAAVTVPCQYVDL